MLLKLFRFAMLAVLAAWLTNCARSPQEKEARFLKSGQKLMDRKDYARALLEFKNAARAIAKDAEPYYRMGVAYLAVGEPAGAVAAFRRATELNPKHTDAQVKLAGLMAASRNREVIEEAERRLLDTLSAAPDNAELVNTLALAEAKLGKVDEAAKRLQEMLQKVPTDLRASVSLARLKLQGNDPEGAETLLKAAVESDPRSPDAAVALAHVYLVREKIDQAEAEIRRALDLDPKHAAALLSLAAIQTSSKRLDQAEETYKRLAALADKRYRPMHAVFLYQQGKLDAALAEFQKLAQDDPNDRASRNRLVAAYVATNRIPDAERVLAAALSRNPKDTDALQQRSELYLRSGKTAEAERDLQQVIRFRPDSAEAHFGLAKVHQARGMTRDQRQELNETLRLSAESLPARLMLARSFTSAKEAKIALDLLDRAPAAQKNVVALVIERNWALLALGNTKEARPAIDAILRVARVPDAMLQDSLVKFQEKDYDGARAVAEELLQQQPEDVRAAHVVVDAYVAVKQMPKAVERMRTLVSQRPRSAPLQVLLGQLLLSTGNRADSRKAFEAAKSADDRSATANLALAEMDVADNQIQSARQRLDAIVAADPRNVAAQLRQADLETRAGNRAAAIAKYRAVLDVNGSNLVALNNLAYMTALDNPDEALKYAQQALELAPDVAAVQDTLGWVYYRKAIYPTAIGYLKTAVAKEPTPRRLFHLGMTYLKAGDQNRGQPLVRTALKQDPNLSNTEQAW